MFRKCGQNFGFFLNSKKALIHKINDREYYVNEFPGIIQLRMILQELIILGFFIRFNQQVDM